MTEPPGVLFEIDVSSAEDGVRVIALRGELDFDESPAFSQVLDELRADGAREIVIDLAGLTFIDSSGISVLVAGARASEEDRGTLIVIAPTAHVRRVFEIVNLSELVAIEPGLEGALEQIARRREQTAG